MNLAALQQEFIGQVLEGERPQPAHWDERMRAGLDVYRNAYRTRLVDALRETFEQTAKWAGEDSFRAAAAHYLISEPPRGWTLDLVGEGFVDTLQTLFANDPDVADLGWLEWTMHTAFTAPDERPLRLEDFAGATSTFAAHEWPAMKLHFLASLQVRPVTTDCASLWHSLRNDETPGSIAIETGPAVCLVWRDDFSPVFRLASELEGSCLDRMMRGAPFEAMCSDLQDGGDDESAAAEAGAMLRRWIEQGLIAAVVGEGPIPADGGLEIPEGDMALANPGETP